MEAAIDAYAPLDYVEFHIFPSENRYEACACYANKKEKVTSGLLEHLLLHSAEIKALHSRESNAKYELSPPENSHDINWFTKSTLIRFLHIIGSTNILDATNSLKYEISQLEEARKFHLSLYAKGTEYQLQSDASDGSYSNSMVSTQKAEGADASKNELLRAMDLRLAALTGELTTAFYQAAGSRCSVEEMTHIQKFSQHISSEDLSNSFRKHIELIQGAPFAENSSSKKSLERDRVASAEANNRTTKSSFSEAPVKYGVSPAKVAQIERQSSTESDDSSFSSEEEQPSVERSRSLARGPSPRRSASPMRRIQIGRSGSRRSTAITIKSLNYYPARERSFLPKDTIANDSDEEGSEQVPKSSESNVRRMSVQDAINLFESKQRDQTVDIQKARSLLNASIGANKSVLRRWSSGKGEDSSQCPQDTFVEDALAEVQNNVDSREITYHSPKSEAEANVASTDYPIKPSKSDIKLNSPEKEACSPVVMQDETLPTETTDAGEKLITSAEWSCQKEAELNELLMKMMETKPVKSRTSVPAGSNRQSFPSEQRGGFYDHYKEKRDEKLWGEAGRKRPEKEKQFRAKQQSVDAKKSQLPSVTANDAGKKQNVKKLQKPQKSISQPANPKTESPRFPAVKKASSKASSLPAARKSWPSMPSSRDTGLSPAKAPLATSSGGRIPTRRRLQPAPPVSHSSVKVETSQMQDKPMKSNQIDSKKSLRSATEKRQQSVTKPRKTAKSKVQTASEDLASAAKPGLYSKVTKKSSVVPLESKPFLRKGSGTISSFNPAVKKKVSSFLQEPLRKSGDLSPADEYITVTNSSDLVIQHDEREFGEMKVQMDVESGATARSPQKCYDKEGFSQVNPIIDDGIDKVVEPESKVELEEESTISPTAWVEIQGHEDHSITSGDICQMVDSPNCVDPVGVSSPRVRHSLSQMLLEESSEPDVIDWGNAENPPPMVYHKDAPKGLKRLLKFARKSRTEANVTGWSSPSIFSEGEDDSEDSKFVNKRSSENLLRKATLHPKNNGHRKSSTDYECPAQANASRFSAQSSSQQLQEGHVSASVTTSKATRSFFSLSAFKGSK